MTAPSPCFSSDAFAFLEALSANNRRDWFADHKQQYEQHIRTPALELVRSFGELLPTLSPHFVADDRKLGGSLMRIHRDTRFGKDKTPYKTNIGIQFRHESGKDVHAPGYYLHISSSECFVGVGIWHPPSDALARIRTAIDEQPERWIKARDDAAFARWFTLTGDTLKSAPRGFDRAHPLIADLKRKDFIAIAQLPAALIEQPDLDRMICDYYATATPLMRFLCTALRLPF